MGPPCKPAIYFKKLGIYEYESRKCSINPTFAGVRVLDQAAAVAQFHGSSTSKSSTRCAVGRSFEDMAQPGIELLPVGLGGFDQALDLGARRGALG